MRLNEILLADNMDVMREIPDGFFELAIVDPPYGINADQRRGDTGKNKHIKQRNYHIGNWDKTIPSEYYFSELFRVSRNQIIWGWNYYIQYLDTCPSYIVWNKDNGENLYADVESAWCSIEGAARLFKWKWHGFLQQQSGWDKENRIHPTQKPVALYKWLLKNYAKPGDKILDTHGGSCSSVIACLEMGFEYLAIEKDPDYHAAAVKRVKQYQSQFKLTF